MDSREHSRQLDHLLLVGGGHAHVAVLADWIAKGLPCRRASLVTPGPYLRYSGTVPGWIAGQYERDEGLVDVEGLARRAGVDFIEGRCNAIDTDKRLVMLEDGGQVGFDIASIDTGGVGRGAGILGDDPRIADIRPIEGFVKRVGTLGELRRIAVAGGGAGGVEVAFGLRNRKDTKPPPEVVLIAGKDGLLNGFSSAVVRRVRATLAEQGIHVIEQDARIDGGQLFAGTQPLEPVDLIVAALGSGAPDWARASGLQCDADGFIAVDPYQRSLSHSCIFAVGDVAARTDRAIPHSGVHAVFAGPVLASNLRAVMAGNEPTQIYRPRWNNLYLMSSGDGAAIASYGPITASGRWVSRLKHAIDMRWLRKYDALARGTS